MSAPTTLIQNLKDALHSSFCEDTSVLTEADPGSKSGETRLTAIHNGLILKLPAGATLFPLFDPKRDGITKLCDYVILLPREKGERLVVLLCELKSTNPKGHLKQLRSGLLLLEYAINVVLLAHPPQRLPPLIEYRGITLTKSPNVSPRGATKPATSTDFLRDGETGLPHLMAAAGREHHINAFCAPLSPELQRRHNHYGPASAPPAARADKSRK